MGSTSLACAVCPLQRQARRQNGGYSAGNDWSAPTHRMPPGVSGECHVRRMGPAPQILGSIAPPGIHSSFFTSSRASSMVIRAGLCRLMYCGAEDTRKPSPLLPPCSEALGPVDGTCLSPGAKRKSDGMPGGSAVETGGLNPGRHPARGEP